MPEVTTLDESIAQAKRMLDAARKDGRADDIVDWNAKLNIRLERKFTRMQAAT